MEKTILAGVRNRFNPFVRKQHEQLPSGIKSGEEFRAIIHRERSRVDRNSHMYSIAVFRVGSNRNDGPSPKCLAEVLTKRMRIADEAGWFDRKHMAVFLDHTSADGAWKYANDICDMVAEIATRPECRVYTYSGSPKNDNNDDFGNRRTTDRFYKRPTDKSDGHSLAVTHGDRSVGTVERSYDSAMHEFSKPTESLWSYMARQMPFYKRMFDIFGSLIGIILLSPLFLITAAIIKIVSPGPVFFWQKRVGYLGRTFRMWKFRTMQLGADQTKHQHYCAELIKSGCNENGENGKVMQKLDDDKDSRVIPLGSILRKSCIDELPQLFNVLRGEMSLIGPRPPIPYEVEEYDHWHYGRFDTVPGMTGLWQVSGKNKTTFKEMVRFDITYARRMSLRLDTKILAGTIPAIITQIRDAL